ncbi:hypothetical protein EV138_2142 [Kribbella voronezhensis]|uniref:Uncharacterized protein n=1 Tax=Kribbella voronezhensis TaxID=2512212 RepID=A0A4R7TB02_9ACTN|nr:hypothetical protein EV138_2142 [Kribbella voronezhensis]
MRWIVLGVVVVVVVGLGWGAVPDAVRYVRLRNM